jgi:hypothetical protein
MMFLAIAALLVGGALVYVFVLRRPQVRSPDSLKDQTSVRRFGGVEIRFRADACEAARSLAGQRFLGKDAPSLPLPGCGAGKCSCTFAKLADRRTDDRRFEHGGLGAALYSDADRRAKRERRAAEKASKRR